MIRYSHFGQLLCEFMYDVSLEPARVLMKFCCYNFNEELFHRFRNIVNDTKFNILGPN